MEITSITINDTKIETKKGITILEAAQAADIYIPRLCSHPDLPPSQDLKSVESIYQGDTQYNNDNSLASQTHEGCQLCVVKIEGIEELVTSCNTMIQENMTIKTDLPEIHDFRQERMMKILANHPHACLTCAQKEGCSREPCSTNVPVEERCCPEFGRCELQRVAEYVGIRDDTPRYKPQGIQILDNEPLFTRNFELCIGCTRCARVCQDIRGVNALGFVFSNGETIVGSIKQTLKESGCKFCGACVEVCPTGALSDKDILWAERENALVPCRNTCPLGTDVPRYIRLIAEGKFGEAAAVIREKTPLPSVLGRVCFHVCETECRRGQLNDPIAICALKRFALEHDTGIWQSKVTIAPATGKKVAIIGSGPTGLTTAYYLARNGHSTVVFDESSELGGMLRQGIPEYRLPREIFDKDLKHISDAGVKFKTNVSVGLELTINDLQREYEAIFISIGAQQAKKIKIEGVELKGVLWGLEFLKDVTKGKEVQVEEKVLVIGGGGVAMDVALIALRLGASEVQVACLESREEMPAHEWEIQEVLDENITIHCSWGPNKIIGTDKVEKAELVQCTNVFDEKGRFNPTFDDSKLKTVETDMVIMAIGQSPDLFILGEEISVQITPSGLINVNDGDLSTNVAGIFAGGEVIKGPLSVVEAIEMGRNAAISIDKYLGGNGNIEEELTEQDTSNPWLGQDEDFFDNSRVQMPCLPLNDRTTSFNEIELGLNESLAMEEAKRCLRCDSRLHFSPIHLPPEKWQEFTLENIQKVPDIEGAFQLLDEDKHIIFIQGTPHLCQALTEQLNTNEKAQFFGFEEDPMYTKKESELLQQFMQKFGKMPESNEDLDDDLF
ncbi:MAG: FAD-dependent oxidoreductase [Candidatus Heimdallarchaeota archaeon]|nr:MAG: FAD-dependent oxidoreductase [Candidatus Heimdallarchaeota archaeon]